ncbi:hypothetical protein [Rariglobus hedericola]|uniref:Uncharacterized protein n=1 Tax=Rariglobus hedericola TaxID=2597822 RepID=A0A556QLL7_9BACT|nr:hypothetical protein [Rariglobus hedericola]TSJ77524.1 hypothetical protein FPL22_15680 [Rariglobus hedericola]
MLWILVALLTAPPLLNLAGYNVFLYIGSDSRKVVIAASQGLCHLATTSETKDVSAFSDYPPEFSEIYMEILKIGPVELFSEKRMDPMQWFQFGIRPKSATFDYSAVEFPWGLLPLAPLIAIYLKRKKKK